MGGTPSTDSLYDTVLYCSTFVKFSFLSTSSPVPKKHLSWACTVIQLTLEVHSLSISNSLTQLRHLHLSAVSKRVKQTPHFRYSLLQGLSCCFSSVFFISFPVYFLFWAVVFVTFFFGARHSLPIKFCQSSASLGCLDTYNLENIAILAFLEHKHKCHVAFCDWVVVFHVCLKCAYFSLPSDTSIAASSHPHIRPITLDETEFQLMR